MKVKVCTKCKIEKSLDEFCYDKRRLDGRRSICKKCHNIIAVKYRLMNKEKVENYNKKYNLEHKKERNIYDKKYYKDHKEERKITDNNYRVKRRKLDISYKILSNLRSRITKAIKNNSKSAKTIKLLGCSVKALKVHLQLQFKPGMTWNNYGYYGWHIDHIKPCAKFNLSKPEEQQKCFNYTNLQPLWTKDNLAKKDKYYCGLSLERI